MKVFECDFCGAKVPHLHPVNGGFWAICDLCMDYYFDSALVDHAMAGAGTRGEEE